MKLYPVRYSKADLEKAPKEERLTFIMGCQLANDLTILKKQILFAVSLETDQEAISHGQMAIATLNIRLLCGRLHEGWESHKKGLEKFCKQYESDLSESALHAWKSLDKYFKNNKNLVTTIRNKVGFHADADIAQQGYDDLPSNVPLIDYLGYQRGNFLYYGSELVTVLSIVNLSGKADIRSGLARVQDEAISMASNFGEVIEGIAKIFIGRYLQHDPAIIKAEAFDLTGLPHIGKISLPFFFEPPKHED